jgi:hypothetical protein
VGGLEPVLTRLVVVVRRVAGVVAAAGVLQVVLHVGERDMQSGLLLALVRHRLLHRSQALRHGHHDSFDRGEAFEQVPVFPTLNQCQKWRSWRKHGLELVIPSYH